MNKRRYEDAWNHEVSERNPFTIIGTLIIGIALGAMAGCVL
jgi:hypothetical protein